MKLGDVKKPDQLYDMHEVSDFMKVSYITLFRMIKSGKIKAQNIARTGKRPIYALRAEDIQAYYDENSTRERDSKRDLKEALGT